ncbi:hypothetical protein ACF0H5_013003 [Mactra antiquata]
MANSTTNIPCVDSCNETSESSNKEYVYVILTAIMAGLSIFGGTCVCIIYIVFKDLRTPGRQLLFFLAFSDAFLAFGNLLGIIWFLYEDSPIIHRSEVYCDFQSAMTIYFSIVSFSWTVIMGTSLFSTVVLNNQSFTSNYMRLFHVIAWIPGGIITLIALSLGVLGTDTSLDQASWCWIDPRVPNALLWQFVTGKFFEIVCYIATVVLYSAIKIFLARQSKKVIGKTKKKSKKDVISEANKKLTFVPLVFIVCRIWGTLRFLIGNFGQDIVNEPYVTWINPLQGIGDSAQGFANFVIYCFSTESIRQRMFPWRRNKVHISETSGYESKTRDSKVTGHSGLPSTLEPPGGTQSAHVDIKTGKNSPPILTTMMAITTNRKTDSANHSTVVNIATPTAIPSKYSVTTKGNKSDEIELTDKTRTNFHPISDNIDNRTYGNIHDNIKCDETTVVQILKPESVENGSNISGSKDGKSDMVASKSDQISFGLLESSSVCIPETNADSSTENIENKKWDTGKDNISSNTGGVYLGTDESGGVYLGTEETGGVYLGTEETGGVYMGPENPTSSRQSDVVVKITPPQQSEEDQEADRAISELKKNKTASNIMNKSRHFSVTVDLHNTDEHGLTGISN